MASYLIKNPIANIPTENPKQICRTSDGILHCVYPLVATKNNIYYAYSDDNGETWEGETAITSDTSYDQGYPSIDVDSSDNLHISWIGKHSGSTTYTQIRYKKRTGTTWGSIVDITSSNYNKQSASILVDSNSYIWIFYVGQSNLYNVKYTSSWGSESFVTGGAYAALKIIEDKSDNIFALYKDSGNDLRIIKYNGSTWSDMGFYGNSGEGDIALDSNGYLYATFCYNNSLYLYKYTTSWDSQSKSASSSWNSKISIDKNDNIYILYNYDSGKIAYVPVSTSLVFGTSVDVYTSYSNTTIHLICSFYPIIDDIETNKPASGFCGLYSRYVTDHRELYFVDINVTWDSLTPPFKPRTMWFN